SHPFGGTLKAVQVLVYRNSQTNLVWNSGKVPASGTTWEVTYNGPTLNPGDVIYWQARHFDEFDIPSYYSGMVFCTILSTPGDPTELAPVTVYPQVYPADT